MPTLQEIRTEIDADAETLGYAALWAQSNGAEAVAAKLNEAGASGEVLFKSYVPIEDVLAEVVLSEYTALTAAQKTALDQFFRGTRVKTGSANMRATLGGLFPTGTTRTAIIAIASRPASRAEALWGEGVRVSDYDVSLAMDLEL